MKIVSFSTKRPVSVVVIFLSLVILGIVSFRELPVDLLPDISFPALTVRTEFPGASPADVEALITSAVESAVGIVSGVVEISSISRAGMSDVTIQFAWGTQMDFAAIDVREQLAQINFPDTAEIPLLLRFDPALDPIMRMSISFSENSPVNLAEQAKIRLIAEKRIKQRIESIEGVAAASVTGGVHEEVQVEVDQYRAASIGLSMSHIISRLQQENVQITGGIIADNDAEYIVRVLAQFADLDEVANLVVGRINDAQVRLEDIAVITIGYKPQTTIIRRNQKPAVEIAIQKEASANTVAVSRQVRQRVNEIENELKTIENLQIQVVTDQARFIEQSIRDVIQAALLGGLLSIAVLYVFLRRLKVTFIVGLAIPISVISSFLFMFLGGVTLNIMSLGGLALGVGMLVDSSIVILESIDRYLPDFPNSSEAARKGAREVGGAVVAATLTTLCVFIPVVFVSGIAGQLFVDPSLTVTFSLLVSLVVALMLVPMAVSTGLKTGEAATSTGGSIFTTPRFLTVLILPARLLVIILRSIGLIIKFLITPLLFLFDWVYKSLINIYPGFLDWVLRHRLFVVIIALSLMGASLYLVPSLGTEMIPEIRQGVISAKVELPSGTPVSMTDKKLNEMQGVVINLDSINQAYAVAGASHTRSSEIRESNGEILFDLANSHQRTNEDIVFSNIRRLFKDVVGVKVTLSRPPLLSFDTAVEVRVIGSNIESIRLASEEIAANLKMVDGLVDVNLLVSEASPEVIINLDPNKLAQFDLDANYVGQVISRKLQGVIATELENGSQDIELRVLIKSEQRATLDDIRNLVIKSVGGADITLSAIAAVSVINGMNEIRKFDQEIVALITANLAGTDLGTVTEDILVLFDTIKDRYNVSLELAGQWQEMKKSFASMLLALLLAITLTYLVMAAQFESLLHPLIIIVSVPFGLVGVVFILSIFDVTISAITLIGVVMMTGIVVNNAIVLVDYINQLRRKGVGCIKAVKEASATRLRPILMTTATTVLGLIPLSLRLGQGWELRQPLALTVIGGLLFSTLITLILIPVVYTIFSRDKIMMSDENSELSQ